MKVEYTEWQGKTEVVEPDEFYMDFLNKWALKSDKYWHECRENNEPYCYGRNDIYLNLYYAETGNRRQVYEQTIIPPEVWEVPQRAYAKLIGFSGI